MTQQKQKDKKAYGTHLLKTISWTKKKILSVFLFALNP